MEKIKERTGIYHEHQEGALCAQHALNNLLQNSFFTADALADIARALDAEEKKVLTHSSYQSENMDDTGFFNIQVLQQALKIFEVELIPFKSQESIANHARNNPASIQAYICNLGLHWFTVRRFGKQYFNLNSMYYAPEYVSPLSLRHNLNILEENGYSVFIVHGNLPHCIADEQLEANPINQKEYELLVKDLPKFMIDGEAMGDLHKGGKNVVRIPLDLYKKFEKNPNDPHVREMVYAYIPEETIDEKVSEQNVCKNPQCQQHQLRRRRQITLAPMLESTIDKKPIKDDIHPKVPIRHPTVSQHFEGDMLDDSDMDDLNGSLDESDARTETAYMTQVIISGTNPNNPNGPHQQRVRQLILISQSSGRNNASIDNQNKNLERVMQAELALQKRRELMLNEVLMAQALLSEAEMNGDMNNSFVDYQTREQLLEQQLLDAAIAASLSTTESLAKDLEKPTESSPLPITNISANTTIDSKPEIIKIPPPLTNIDTPSSPLKNTNTITTTDTSSSPLKSTHPVSPTNTSSTSPITTNSFPSQSTNSIVPNVENLPSPTVVKSSLSTETISSSPKEPSSPSPNITDSTTLSKTSPSTLTIISSSPPNTTNLISPTMINSPPIITTNFSRLTTTSSPPPIVTNSDLTTSLSVEEIRLQRLQSSGNKHRSIICAALDSDDEINS